MPKKETYEAMRRAGRVRATMARHNLRYYDLADHIGKHYNTINRWMRCGLDEDHYKIVMAALVEMLYAKGGANHD